MVRPATSRVESLVATLETYLDAAGDAAAVAETMSIHRTTLYYRLGRIQKITGADLSDGEQRLALHAGLKLVRLAGASAGLDAAAPPAW